MNWDGFGCLGSSPRDSEERPLLCPESSEEAQAALLLQLRELNVRFLQEQERLVREFGTQLKFAAEIKPAADDSDPPPDSGRNRNVQMVEEEILTGSVQKPADSDEDENDRSVPHGMKHVGLSTPAVEEEDPALEAVRGLVPAKGPVRSAYRWWKHLDEPKREGALARMVASWRFETLTVVMILLNGALVVYQTDIASKSSRTQEEGPHLLTSDVIVEAIFVVFFLAELFVKLIVHKLYFFVNKDMWWNIFDVLTISAAAVGVVINLEGAAGNDALDVSFLRVLRVFRMTRSLRILRALHFIRSLRQLVDCIISSFSGLFWCMVLLVFLDGIFAVFLVQCATVYWQEGDVQPDPPTSSLVTLEESFGSVRNAMFSLFRATSGGADWGSYFLILGRTGYIGPTIFVFYILFFIIAAWNIVTSLFLEKALSIAQPDIETQMLNKKRKDMADAKDLAALIQAIDDDKSGTISLVEFNRWMNEPTFRRFFEMKDIDIKDAELFFHMLEAATNSEEIQLSVVVNGLMRMRGIATNLDLQALNFTINTVYMSFNKDLKVLLKEVKRVSKELEQYDVRNALRRPKALRPAS